MRIKAIFKSGKIKVQTMWQLFGEQTDGVHFKNTIYSSSDFKFGLDKFDHFAPLVIHFSDP